MYQEQQTSSPNLTFFPIANPTSLLNSSSIPQPIILPPGSDPIIHPPESDPYSTPIPGENRRDGLETLPALDIDPYAASYAASWREITTQTSDLTPAEHAGGPLNETTEVSTTLHSSENSGFVTQQVVNDVIETTMQNENTQSIQCEVCNVTCSSEDVLKKHKQGKKHLKNLQKLTVSSADEPKRPPPVASATLDGELEKKKHKLLENGASVNSLMICDICNVVCNNQDAYGKHLEGKKHAAQVTSRLSGGNGLSNPTSASTIPVQPSNSGPQEQAEEKSNDVQSDEWCELCKVSCSSQTIFNRHISGRQHLKNLKNSQNIPITGPVEDQKSTSGLSCSEGFSSLTSVSTPPVEPSNSATQKQAEEKPSPGQPAWYELCKVGCSSNEVLENNLTESEKIPSPLLTPIVLVDTTPITELLESPKSTMGEVVKSKEGKSLWCELCGISCDTYEVLNCHISGKKHQKNMKKSQQPVGPNPTPVTQPATATQIIGPLQDSVNEEGKVVDLESHKRKANSSVASREDLETKKQKMMKGGAASDSLRTCTLCNVVCNSPTAFTSHLAGLKHTAKAMKQTEAGSNGERA